MHAVVCRTTGTCQVEAVEPRRPGPGDVLVRIDASGICHSDVSVFDGTLGGTMPIALGHEGAATVVEVGRQVTRVRPGDRVILSAIAACGACHACVRGQSHLCQQARAARRPPLVGGDGADVHGVSGLGTLATAITVSEQAVVKVTSALPAEQLAVIGCAIATGTGAALHLADIAAGDVVVVIGGGGVGLAAVQGARVRNAAAIIVVDPAAAARQAALACGATHAVAPGAAAEEMVMLFSDGHGADSVIDCVGAPATVQAAWRCSRRGATIVLIGVPGPGVAMPIPIADIVTSGKTLVGCVYGGTQVPGGLAHYAAMAERGQLDLAAMVGRTITLAEAAPVIAAWASIPPGPGRTIVLPT